MTKDYSTYLRTAAMIVAGLMLLSIMGSTLLQDFFYGSVTHNGNRYYHVSPFRIDWVMLIMTIVAYFLLLLPWVKYAIKKNRELFSWGIFPATNMFAKCLSVLLTFFSISTGGLFTLAHLVYNVRNVTTGSTILSDDRGIILVAYAMCIIIWGIVCGIYKLVYWRW